jgi:hypothetical protein
MDDTVFSANHTDASLVTMRELAAEGLARLNSIDSPEDAKFTCDHCPWLKSCVFAFDLYNTNGDCIALK